MCPSSVRSTAPEAASRIRTVEPSPPVASHWPSGLKWIARTDNSCGLLDQTARASERLEKMEQSGGGRIRRALLALSAGDIRAALGDTAGAVARYDEALAICEEIDARSLFVQAVVGRAAVAAGGMRSRLERALLLCNELRLERFRGRLLQLLEGGRVTAEAAAAGPS